MSLKEEAGTLADRPSPPHPGAAPTAGTGGRAAQLARRVAPSAPPTRSTLWSMASRRLSKLVMTARDFGSTLFEGAPAHGAPRPDDQGE